MTLPNEIRKELDKLKGEKLPKVCFFCRARLEHKDHGNSWKYIENPAGKVVPVCQKHVHK